MAAQSLDPDPDTAIRMDFKIFIFASIAVSIVGMLIGSLELFVFSKYFRYKAFFHRIAFKLLIYILILILLMVCIYPFAASLESGLAIWDTTVLEKTRRFLSSSTFINSLFQMSISLAISLLYAGISEHIGYGIINNFFLGKYDKAIKEERIFMFADMKSSTTIAEKLGHENYFHFIDDYFNCFSDQIINHKGEVYQYVGDELVITWSKKSGLKDSNVISLYHAMKKSIELKADYFLKKYGAKPDFRAGIHLGEVSTGKVGALKKEIVFTGDVLNTSSRIQHLGKKHQNDLLISEDLYELLDGRIKTEFDFIADEEIRGRSKRMNLYGLI